MKTAGLGRTITVFAYMLGVLAVTRIVIFQIGIRMGIILYHLYQCEASLSITFDGPQIWSSDARLMYTSMSCRPMLTVPSLGSSLIIFSLFYLFVSWSKMSISTEINNGYRYPFLYIYITYALSKIIIRENNYIDGFYNCVPS